MSGNDASVTRALSQAASSISLGDLPAEAIFLARQCLLDWFGCALAGAREPLATILREEALEAGGNSQASLVGDAHRVGARQAALINGAASHALDYDDVHLGLSGHPTVPVAPAVLALGEKLGASGGAVVAAFVAGIEVECRIGALVMPGHYTAGWHATGTIGTFGAAAACAHLLGLPLEGWENALGIAGAQAAGLKSMFGTMCKPLHAGKAAENGLFAATLAGRGFTSNAAVLDVAQGFTATQTTTPHPERALDGLGESLAINGVLFKYHAACYGTHETIEGVLRLREQHHLQPDQIESIRLTVPQGHLAMCNIQEPATALEGKFSLRFTAALAASGAETTEAAFTDKAVRRPDLVALRDRVEVVPATERRGAGTDVSITMSDGRTVEQHVNLETPATDLERQWQRLEAKFLSLAEPAIGRAQALRLRDAIAAIESAPAIGDVVRLATQELSAAAR